MPKTRNWTDDHLKKAVKSSRSYREALIKLNLIPAGGNYVHVKRKIAELHLDTSHFLGKGWNVGLLFKPKKVPKLEEILVQNSQAQSYKLKKRLFAEGVKTPKCEICGWAEKSIDGRIPVELDHINGKNSDNRINNLRVLCPNCHSLQITHRGKNKFKRG